MASTTDRSSRNGRRKRARAPRPATTAVTGNALDPARPQAAHLGYRLSDEQVEHDLATGENAVALESYFGEAAYRDLRRLAVEAQTRGKRGGPRVLILPGIMGSKLGIKRSFLDDVIWVDPIDVARGQLGTLTLDGRPSRITALGVILLAYLKLKLTLMLDGFDVDFHPFDWRQEIAGQGDLLADRIRHEGGKDVYLVAHSMGGLVARAALKKGLPQVKRLIMLGTPNHGSFSVPQALRAAHSMVRTVAALDLHHTPEQLAADVFSTFPGLYQMMPWREKFSGVDFYNASTWPSQGPRARQALLDGIIKSHDRLAAPDERFVLIAGINRETVVGATQTADDFVYTVSREGDGTVPLAFAQLPDVPTYFIEEDHGMLPNNGAVAAAISDLLRRPTTDRLPTSWTPQRASTRTVREADLRIEPFGGRRGNELTSTEIRNVLAPFAAPPAPEEAAALVALDGGGTPAFAERPQFQHVVVGRRRQHRLDVTVAQGSITEVNARAYVLGVFKDVDPTGAAAALDQRLDGAISQFSARRMLSGGVGETFVLPVGRSTLQADLVILAGMGSFDSFTPEAQSLVAENVIRICVQTRIEEFATVMFGSGSGRSIKDSLANMCRGFIRGLGDADREHRFRRIILCERDPERFAELKQALYDLCSQPLFEDTEITLDEVQLPTTIVASSGEPSRQERLPNGRDPVYALVREGALKNGDLSLEVALLGADGKATVVREEISFKRAALEALLDETSGLDWKHLVDYGVRLGDLVLPPRIRALLATMKDRHLVVVHDSPSSRIPWEALHVRDGQAGTSPGSNGERAKPRPGNGVAATPKTWAPALGQGLSRRYMAGNLSIAKWMESRRNDQFLDVLLVTNPTGDLPGAEKEGAMLARAFGAGSAVRVKEIRGPDATRPRLLEEFGSGRYDVIHYAGHAFFDPQVPSKSGIICAGREPLTGADLTRIGNLPSLIFFNACEAGRIRRGADPKSAAELPPAARIARSTGFAEAFLRGGAANYVGTYWPVGDAPAELFAGTFYGDILRGATIAMALLKARQALYAKSFHDWADYIHYGSPDFVVKTANREATKLAAAMSPA